MDSCPVCHQGFGLSQNRVLVKDCGCGPVACTGHPYHYEHTRCYDGSRGSLAP